MLAKIDNLVISRDLARPKNSVVAISSKAESYIDISQTIDIEKEIARQEKLLADVEKSLGISERKLSNKNFLEKAPRDVVEKEKARYEELKQKEAKIKRIIESLKEILKFS
jgi:valyl-tRNA synthetase